jgi:hypothetical protein
MVRTPKNRATNSHSETKSAAEAADPERTPKSLLGGADHPDLYESLRFLSDGLLTAETLDSVNKSNIALGDVAGKINEETVPDPPDIQDALKALLESGKPDPLAAE